MAVTVETTVAPIPNNLRGKKCRHLHHHGPNQPADDGAGANSKNRDHGFDKHRRTKTIFTGIITMIIIIIIVIIIIIIISFIVIIAVVMIICATLNPKPVIASETTKCSGSDLPWRAERWVLKWLIFHGRKQGFGVYSSRLLGFRGGVLLLRCACPAFKAQQLKTVTLLSGLRLKDGYTGLPDCSAFGCSVMV